MKKWRSILLLLCLLLIQSSQLVVAAEAPDSVINRLYPTEEEMKIETDVELEYKKVPPEFYKWDSNLKFAEWDGLFPELKNPGDVSENTIWAAVFRSSVQLVRFGIFLLQMGFSTNILTTVLDDIDSDIAMISDHFFNKVFPTAATLLVIFMIIAWVRGQKGQMISIMLVALIVSTLLIGGIKHLDTLGQVASGIIDDLSLNVLGITNLGSEEDTSERGLQRLAQTNNIIWQVTVDKPWTAGQFGSLTAPSLMEPEITALEAKGITISSRETWKDLFLKYAPGSIERQALVDILADDDIQHASQDASDMMKELAPTVRTMVSVIAFLNSLAFLLVASVVAGLMNISGILLLGGMVAAPIMVPMPFLAWLGMNIVKKYLGSMISFGLLKITATAYISIVMLLLFLISLTDWHFIIIQGITLLILAVSIYFSPFIWRKMTPGLARLSGVAEQSMRQAYRKVAPQENVENLYERYGKIRQDNSTEQLIERQRSNRIQDSRQELQSLEQLKSENSIGYQSSGLEQRELELRKELRKDELSKFNLTNLQNERFKYENKKLGGEQLTRQDQADLRMIQQAERKQIRSIVNRNPEKRQELEQIWRQGTQLHNQVRSLQQQKAADPLSFIANGGDTRLNYLRSQERMNQAKERDILKANSLNDANLSKEEKRERSEMNEYLRSQEGASVYKNHASNLIPEMDRADRIMEIEAMSQEDLQEQQELYHIKTDDYTKELSYEDQQDYVLLQHHDWMDSVNEIEDAAVRQEVEGFHLQELSYESQLLNFNQIRQTDPEGFQSMGGEQKRQELQQNIFQSRQQSQEVLRQNGYRDMAELHVQLAENRDMIREIPKTNPPDETINNGESKVIQLRNEDIKKPSPGRDHISNKQQSGDKTRPNHAVQNHNRVHLRDGELNDPKTVQHAKTEIKQFEPKTESSRNDNKKVNDMNHFTIAEAPEGIYTNISYNPQSDTTGDSLIWDDIAFEDQNHSSVQHKETDHSGFDKQPKTLSTTVEVRTVDKEKQQPKPNPNPNVEKVTTVQEYLKQQKQLREAQKENEKKPIEKLSFEREQGRGLET